MRRHAVLAGALGAVLGVAPAAAKPAQPLDDQLAPDPLVVATDPVETETAVVTETVIAEPVITDPIVIHEPYQMPVSTPPPAREVPRESVVVWASGLQAWVSEQRGMTSLGQGASLSFAFLQRRGDDFPTGFDMSAVFLSGERASVYDLAMRLVVSAKIEDRPVVPFIALGLAAGASRLVTDEQKMSGEDVAYGWAIGPAAGAGLHGFLSEKVYWRASAGFLGTGVGALTADVGLGLTVD